MPEIDTDELPPTQYLVLEVLAARHRLGETTWSFPTSLERALLALQSAGLIDTFGSTRPKTVRARLTEAGKAAAERNVPRNPRPLCEDFVAQPEPAEFWCATCKWNRPMHDMPEHRAAIAAELERLASAPNPSAVDHG